MPKKNPTFDAIPADLASAHAALASARQALREALAQSQAFEYLAEELECELMKAQDFIKARKLWQEFMSTLE